MTPSQALQGLLIHILLGLAVLALAADLHHAGAPLFVVLPLGVIAIVLPFAYRYTHGRSRS